MRACLSGPLCRPVCVSLNRLINHYLAIKLISAREMFLNSFYYLASEASEERNRHGFRSIGVFFFVVVSVGISLSLSLTLPHVPCRNHGDPIGV